MDPRSRERREPGETKSTRRRVLYVQHSAKLGGAPRSLLFLLAGAERYGIDATVAFLASGPGEREFRRAGHRVVRLAVGFPFHGSTVSGMSWKLFARNLIGLVPTALSSAFQLVRLRPDVLHLNSTCLFAIALVFRVLRPRTRIICHAREELLPGPAGLPLRVLNRIAVDRFIAISRPVAESLRSGRTEVIHNFVDTSVYRRNRDRLDTTGRSGASGGGSLTVLYLARVASGNGPMLFVRLAQMFAGKPAVRFRMIGFSEPAVSALEHRVRRAASRVPNLTCETFCDDVIEVLHQTDLLVVPFDTPHFSRSVVEAGALEVPAVVSDLRGFDDQVIDGETGIVCRTGDVEAFAAGVRRLLDDRGLRTTMGRNARRFVEQEYSATGNVERTFGTYSRTDR